MQDEIFGDIKCQKIAIGRRFLSCRCGFNAYYRFLRCPACGVAADHATEREVRAKAKLTYRKILIAFQD